jgi:hypothetical protein
VQVAVHSKDTLARIYLGHSEQPEHNVEYSTQFVTALQRLTSIPSSASPGKFSKVKVLAFQGFEVSVMLHPEVRFQVS